MAENRHVQHLRSKVVESNGKPKLPSSSALTFGEIAVNYAENVETLSIKNENGNIVVFSSDDYYTKEKLGSAFTNSDKTVTDGLNEKVNNDELDDKIADAIATADTVSGAIETIVNDKLAAYSSATEIEEALSGKSDVGHHHVVADIDDFESGVENVVSLSETITERIENVVASAITNNESVSASVESVISAFTEETLDDRYAFKEHTHEASAITDFNSAVEGVVSTSSTITERIENVVASAITDNGSVSASVSTIVEGMLADYTKTEDLPTDLSAFTNSPKYVKEDEVNGLVADAISDSDAVISAITEILSNDSGITEVINNVVSGQIEGSVSGKADSDDVQEWIEAATSGKVDTTAFTAFTSSTETTLGNKADSSAVTESIEAATSGKVDTSVYEQFTGDTETALGNKVSNDTYTAYTAATEAVLSGKADVSDLSNYFDSVDYTTSGDSHVIKFYHGETLIDYINADDFIKDGMVDNVEIADVSGVTSLIIAFNEDGGKERIVIPISDIFDASNYYTSNEIDGKFLTISAASDTYVTNANFNTAVSSAITNNPTVSGDIVSIINGELAEYWTSAETQTAINDAITQAGGVTTGTVQTMIDNSISGKADSSTTLSGYGITDANIQDGVITLGNNTIEPLTSYTVTSGDVTSALGYTPAQSSHTHTSSDITNFSSAVENVVLTSDTINENIVNVVSGSISNPDVTVEIVNAVTASTAFTSLSGDVYTISGTVNSFQTELNGKANVNHEHASSAITSMAGYSKPSTTSAIATGDSLNTAIGKLERAIDDATAGGVASVSLTGGTNNGTLKLTVNSNETDNIAVTGLGSAAYLNTGKTSNTVAIGDHTHATSIATSTATNQITLGYGNKYSLNAGGNSYIFTMPSSASTWENNYYISGATVSANTTDVKISLSGNNTAAKATAIIPAATESSAGTMSKDDKVAVNKLKPLSGNVSTLSAITATSTAINSLTGSVGTMAYENKTSYSSATQVNTALAGKSNTGHTHYTNEITKLSGYTIASTASAIATGDTLNVALGKIQKSLDSKVSSAFTSIKLGSSTIAADSATDTFEIVSGDSFINLSADTTNDKLKISINTGITNTTVAVGNHTHASSDVTDFSSAVENVVSTSSTISGTVKTIVTNAMSTDSSVSGAVDTIVDNNAKVVASKTVTDFLSGHSEVNTLANIPTTRRLVIATISSSTNELSLSGNTLTDGSEIHVIVKNNGSSDATVTLPTSGGYVSVGNAITIAANSTGEINIISDGTNLYVRGA